MDKAFFLVFLALFLFLLISHIQLPVHAQVTTITKNNNRNKTNVGCNDLADFYYEIILGVTTYPQALCSEKEEAEIAAVMQDGVNAELDSLPGTIKTSNKVCGRPVNSRRQLLKTRNQIFSNKTTFSETGEESSALYLRGSVHPTTGRILYRRRSFIYVGGGKCRYCLRDNFDGRALLLSPSAASILPPRDLMYKYIRKPNHAFPKVSDISLCKVFRSQDFSLDDKEHIEWINRKKPPLKTTSKDNHFMSLAQTYDLLGPYKAGERFGFQLSMGKVMHDRNDKKANGTNTLVKAPVKSGTFQFRLYSFDVPMEFSNGMLDDEPLFLFMNGIKLDLNLLISQQGSSRRGRSKILHGSSFAGIDWMIRDITTQYHDHAAPRNGDATTVPIRIYEISIAAPLIVFAHKNVLDIDFMIKQNSKAKHYGIGDLGVSLTFVHCQVTDLDDSPFYDFKSAVESKLFHKLGMDLALQFQDKQEHCLNDKIPIVEVHLVEKENWKETNPRCN